MHVRMAILGLAVLCAGCGAGEHDFDIDFGAGEAETISASNIRLTYLEKGEGDPVVFFYPRTDARYWQFQIDAFAETHRALAFDYEPEQPIQESPVAPDSLIAALEILRDELGVDRLNLVTHSFSARQAMEIAIARPDLFSSLVLEEPGGAPSREDNVQAPTAQCESGIQDPMALQTCQFLSPLMGPGRFEALPAEVQEYLIETQGTSSEGVDAAGGDAFLAFLTQLLTRPICSELGELSMPILFVRGAETPAWLQGMMDAYEECLPPHETALIAGATHMAHLEAPASFNRAVLAFLGRL